MSTPLSTSNPWAPDRWTVSESDLVLSLPRVTIGILNYNRKSELRRTLECLTLAIQYPNLEIIVVDNASTDGSPEMIASEFASVRCIQMMENIAVAARNEFYREATGKYVFSYDDDSMPATPATVFEVVRILEEHPEFDSIAMYCYQPINRYGETDGLEGFGFHRRAYPWFEGLFFVEGGMCVRKSSFDRCNGYDDQFFWGGEGFELTLQMYKLGLRMIYYPAMATLHLKSHKNRTHSTNIYFVTRNQIWTIWKHFPFYAACIIISAFILRKVVSMILHPNNSANFLKGIAAGLSGWRAQRKRTSKLRLHQVIGLRWWYAGLLRW
jgi:GT2 family glycosyltransferase